MGHNIMFESQLMCQWKDLRLLDLFAAFDYVYYVLSSLSTDTVGSSSGNE